jgi:hypothetical protein
MAISKSKQLAKKTSGGSNKSKQATPIRTQAHPSGTAQASILATRLIVVFTILSIVFVGFAYWRT